VIACGQVTHLGTFLAPKHLPSIRGVGKLESGGM